MIPNDHTRLAIALDRVEHAMNWLVRAKDGWTYQYHVGFLLVDREKDLATDLIGTMFRLAYEGQLVSLTQKMEADGAHYWARRSRQPLSTAGRNALQKEISEYAKFKTDGQGIDG